MKIVPLLRAPRRCAGCRIALPRSAPSHHRHCLSCWRGAMFYHAATRYLRTTGARP